MTPLNVIALISGGKDSLFSILHCQANGHTVVALANLYPTPSTNDEDINSYMYQTIGHFTIPLYEQALGIPLYRQEITGKALNSNREYEAPLAEQEQGQDETEDLVPLLRRVMVAHPEANAVSTGAILSTYQRTRVESVTLRLGLTPLSYLWQYPILPPYTQSSLLHDMSVVGQEAIIIKTASGGLDESFLGFDVASQRTIARLGKAMSRFSEESNGAILGEGGEFETLALYGPRPLWKKRIKVELGRPGKMAGGQAVLKIQANALELKTEDTEETGGTLRIPELFDDEFKQVLKTIEGSDDNRSVISDDATLVNVPFYRFSASSETPITDKLPKNATSDTPTMFTYSNMTSDARQSSAPGSPSGQLSKIFLRLDHILTQWHVDKAAINHCTLLLRDMANFTVINPIYGQYFSSVSPPARATIAVGDAMPEGIEVMLSLVADKNGKDKKGKVVRAVEREGLHVQSRSYWAPANIGPYSQAISVRLPMADMKGQSQNTELNGGRVVYVAGQIPLHPAMMEAYNDKGFKGQAALSLQHLWRIGRTKSVKWWLAGVGFIPSCENPEEKVVTAQAAWNAIHTSHSSSPNEGDEEEDADIDPWDRMNRPGGSTFNDTTYRAPIPDTPSISSPTNPDTTPIPPCFMAQVHALPRGVDIEWSTSGITSPATHFTRSLAHSNLTITTPLHTRTRFYTLEIREQRDIELLRRLGENSVKDWTSATLYAGPGLEWAANMSLRGVQWIPCLRVWGEGGREVRAVLVGRVDREDQREGSVMGKFVSSLRFNSV